MPIDNLVPSIIMLKQINEAPAHLSAGRFEAQAISLILK
jgi:hypothetical protein